MRISLEKFQEQGGRLRSDDLDFDAFRDAPLDDDVLRCISYMHDIEYQTVLYTRELLLTVALPLAVIIFIVALLWPQGRAVNGEGMILPRLRRPVITEAGGSWPAYFCNAGLGSKVSTCDGPPSMNRKITLFAFAG